MQIIPALYIKHHRFALFQPGNPSYIEYLPTDPYELVSTLAELNIPRIHVIDQDTWSEKLSPNTGLIGSLCKLCNSRLEVGGGIRNLTFLHRLKAAGVQYFVVGSALYDNFSFLVEISKDSQFSNQNFLISIDIDKGKLAHSGSSIDKSISAKHLIRKCMDLGFNRFILNDLDIFQVEAGPDVCFYRSMTEAFPTATFSASGRVITMEHIEALQKVNVVEAMVGNEIYRIPGLLEQISQFNSQHEQIGMA